MRSAVICGSQGFVDGEAVDSFKGIWVIPRAKDLPLLPLPLGLIDGIDPILNLHHETTILLDDPGTTSIVEETLSVLQGKRPLKLSEMVTSKLFCCVRLPFMLLQV